MPISPPLQQDIKPTANILNGHCCAILYTDCRQYNKTRKRKRIHIRMEEGMWTLSANMILPIKYLKESTKQLSSTKLADTTRVFQKPTQSTLFLYTRDDKPQNEIENTISFTRIYNRIKHLGIIILLFLALEIEPRGTLTLS